MAKRIHAERSDLQQLVGPPEGTDFAMWMASSGALEYPRVARWYPPVPGEELRRTDSGGTKASEHLYTGLRDLRSLAEALRQFTGRGLDQVGRLLDFGAGCGRILRWFHGQEPGRELFGCDVRKAGMDWCAAHLDGAYLHSPLLPPLPYQDGQFDLILSLSVFSHLDCEAARAWLSELRRLCHPKGHLLISTHGAFSLWAISQRAELQDFFELGPQQASALAERVQAARFGFHPIPDRVLATLEGPDRSYGHAFFNERFFRDAYGDLLEIVACLPAALGLFQDIYVLRPR